MRFRESKCHDPRDNIFGLHSLARRCRKAGTPVDYSKTATQLCDQLLKHHFLSHGDPLSTAEVIGTSELAYRILGDLAHSEEGQPSNGAEIDKETVTALGNVRGAITFISPSLEILSDSTLGDIISNDYQPELTPWLASQLVIVTTRNYQLHH
jgi:hypothetical protein